MASSQRPRMSLPPELNAIDDGWGDDESPTIARPSRLPTAPVRKNIVPNPFPVAPSPLDIELSENDDDDSQDRVTAIPEIPLDAYARQMMSTEAQEAATEAPPPPAVAHPGISLESRPSKRETETLNELNLELTEDLAVHPSDWPTAPPPEGFEQERIGTIPRPAALQDLVDSVSPERLAPESVFPERLETPVPIRHRQADPQQVMKDKFAMGDFSGALEAAESILNTEPQNIEARSLLEKCREVLQDMYSSRINGMERVPRVSMSQEQIRWLSLDHREGFMLSMIDGVSSVDDLLDVSGMQRMDAMRIICSLLDQKVVSLS